MLEAGIAGLVAGPVEEDLPRGGVLDHPVKVPPPSVFRVGSSCGGEARRRPAPAPRH